MKKLLLLIITVLFSQPLWAAGFHYEIAVNTTLNLDENHQLQSLSMQWLNDQNTSELLLDGSDTSTPMMLDLTLKSISKRMTNALKKVDYLTHLGDDSGPIALGDVKDYQLQLNDDKQLLLTFHLPLKKPYPLSQKPLTLSHADPNGTAILLYRSAEHIQFNKPDAQCKTQITEPALIIHGESAQLIQITCNNS